MNRRDVLKKICTSSALVALSPTIVPASVLSGRGHIVPSDKIVMACIGVGSMGSGHVRSFLGFDDVKIVAICDVRKEHRDRAKKMVDRRYDNNDCVTIKDFRELLDRDDIDAITNVTPDHWHVLIGLEAARKGKDMYFEKPLSRSIHESIVMREAIHHSNVIFQFGTQQRSDIRFRHTCELIQNGKIGNLQTIMIGSASFDQIPNQVEQPVPPGFDYDMWLGPAPWTPYTFERCTRQWTLISDYSLGCVGGAWGIHSVDIAQWANQSDHAAPITIEGNGEFPVSGLFDTAQHWEVEHTYSNGVKLIHMDMHTAKKRAWQFELFWMAILFIGSEGWIYVGRDYMNSEPKSLLTYKFKSNEKRLPESKDQRRNFLDCVKSRKQPISDIESAFFSDVACHHADIAMKTGRKLTWNNATLQFENDNKANRLLKRSMRSPWHL